MLASPAGRQQAQPALPAVGRPHAVSQPLLCSYKKCLVFSIHFHLCPPPPLPMILPTPDEQAASTTGWGRCRWQDTYLMCHSPCCVTSTVPGEQRCLQAAIQRDQTWGLCREPVPSQSLESGHNPSWELGQRPHLPSQLVPPATGIYCVCSYFPFLVPMLWISFV